VPGARDPAASAALAAETGACIASPAKVAQAAEVIMLSLPWGLRKMSPGRLTI